MRDPNRLDNFYEELKNIHKEFFPDWRFCQLIVNFTDWAWGEKGIGIFFLEEDRMLQSIKDYKDFLFEKDKKL